MRSRPGVSSRQMLDEQSFRTADLCIVGNINRDVRISPIPADDYLFADGETSVAAITETAGGGGANSAFAAAALGARVAFLGRVGNDWLGDRLEREKRRAHPRPPPRRRCLLRP